MILFPAWYARGGNPPTCKFKGNSDPSTPRTLPAASVWTGDLHGFAAFRGHYIARSCPLEAGHRHSSSTPNRKRVMLQEIYLSRNTGDNSLWWCYIICDRNSKSNSGSNRTGNGNDINSNRDNHSNSAGTSNGNSNSNTNSNSHLVIVIILEIEIVRMTYLCNSSTGTINSNKISCRSQGDQGVAITFKKKT